MKRKSGLPTTQECYELLRDGRIFAQEAGIEGIPDDLEDRWIADGIAEKLGLKPWQRTLVRMKASMPAGSREIEFTGRRLVAMSGGKVTHVWTGKAWRAVKRRLPLSKGGNLA